MRVTLAGGEVRRHREAAGFTQEQLAQRAGISWRTVVRIETGATERTNTATAAALARGLGLASPDAILDTSAGVEGFAP